jgi:primosomal protein N' (replication factor Y)
VVRVLPAVAGLDKEFDYRVPDELGAHVRVGSVVRVDLSGRRVAAWVVADPVEPVDGRPLRPILRVTGWGPEPELVALAGWAAWRWAGRRNAMLGTATGERATPLLPSPALRPPPPPPDGAVAAEVTEASVVQASTAALSTAEASTAGTGSGPVILRLPPASDPTATVAAVAQRGPTLVLLPSADRARVLAGRLRRAGADVALLPGDWAQARAGAAVVVGARAAAWGPCPGLAAVVVIDGHDEALVQEQAPTWGAVEVAAERARRAGALCVVTSPCPGVELVARGRLVVLSPDVERAGWSVLDVVDRRRDDPRQGLYSRPVVDAVRDAGTVLCVLNRLGRARLLACSACGTVADCERCGAAVGSVQVDELMCPRCRTVRPVVCRACQSTRLKQLRVGVSRAREELEALAGRAVGEVTGAGVVDGQADVMVGTEAVLHQLRRVDTVIFLDFDQHLLAARYRAHEEAMGLLARAARLTGGRRRTAGRAPGRVVVQTREPEHPVLMAAAAGDPGRLADGELRLRRELGLPPVTALASVSGPAAAEFVDRLRQSRRRPPAVGVPGPPPAVEILGPDGDRWLLRAPDHTALADALAVVPRPPGRLRIEVDPRRV